jgi:hypothetical protein
VEEIAVVKKLCEKLKLKIKVLVTRWARILKKNDKKRESLRRAYRAASKAVNQSTREELDELDHLASENLE